MFYLSSLIVTVSVFCTVFGKPPLEGKRQTDGCTYNRGEGRDSLEIKCLPGSRVIGEHCYPSVSYGRGAGRMPEKAPCPSGLRDDGTSCWSDAHIYGKGCCCWWGSCCSNCRRGYNDDGCTCRKTDVGIKLNLFQRQSCRSNEDKYGGLCYPKCRQGFRAVGCCICEPGGKTRAEPIIRNCRHGEDLCNKVCFDKCKYGYRPLMWSGCPTCKRC